MKYILPLLLASMAANAQNGLSLSGTYNSDKSLYDISVKGNYAYLVGNVSGLADGLEVVDVSNAGSPVYTGSTGVTFADEDALSVEANPGSNVVYMGTNKKFYNIDVTNPASPSPLFSATVNGETWGLFFDNNFLYGTRYNFGVARTNVSNPSSPVSSGGYTTGGNDACQNVFVKGNYAYVVRRSASGSNQNTLWILDKTNSSFQLTGNFNSSPFEKIWDVYVDNNNYAYLANGKNGVTVVDVSNPASPSEVTKIQESGANLGAYAVEVYGNFLFVADGDKGLLVYDIADPSSPSLIDSDNSTGGYFKVRFLNNKVYCIGASTSNEKKMVIYDFNVASGVKEIAKNNLNVTLFPNPVNNQLHIRFDQHYPSVEVSINNTLGQLVHTQQYASVNSIQQNMELPSGIYFATIKAGNASSTVKFIKH